MLCGSSVVIAGVAQVAVRRQLKGKRFGRVRSAPIPAAFEDRLHALARGAAEEERQSTRRLQARSAILAGERQEPQTRSIALLRMGLRAQQMLNDGAGVDADR
jgi:hypothetical protein